MEHSVREFVPGEHYIATLSDGTIVHFLFMDMPFVHVYQLPSWALDLPDEANICINPTKDEDGNVYIKTGILAHKTLNEFAKKHANTIGLKVKEVHMIKNYNSLNYYKVNYSNPLYLGIFAWISAFFIVVFCLIAYKLFKRYKKTHKSSVIE